MLKIVLSLFILLITAETFCQSFPVSREFLDAVNAGTRTFEGKPGKIYWQNSSDYFIKADFNPSTGELKGSEIIKYYNNSPDSLTFITIRLLQNIYKATSQRDFNITEEGFTDGVKIKKLIINSVDHLNLERFVRTNGTNMTVRLNKAIQPNTISEIEIEWEFTVSKFNELRIGRYNDDNYFIAYWYPQISVYDDIFGWDNIQYKGNAEFYNDFNNYEVELTVPGNYIVWATGELQNNKELFTVNFNTKYENAKYSDEVINLISEVDLANNVKIFKNNNSLTYKYKATHVPDFSFAVSNNYLWDATSVEINGKRVFIQAGYRKTSNDFKEISEITRQTLLFFSNEMPGFPYEYPALTFFDGRGGMEFPMMVNQGSSDRQSMVFTATHELAHMYFPFMLGVNERRNAWFDEGLAIYLPNELNEILNESENDLIRYTRIFQMNAGTSDDVGLNVPSYFINNYPYQFHTYVRSGIAFLNLEKLMGKELFKTTLQIFMKEWQGKHPLPEDLFFAFEKGFGKSLGWFINPWFFSTNYADLALTEIKTKDNGTKIIIEKVGGLPVPVYLNILLKDDKIETYELKADIWTEVDNILEIYLEDLKFNSIKNIELGNGFIPDSYLENNYFVNE